MTKYFDEFGDSYDYPKHDTDPPPMPWKDSTEELIRRECDSLRDMLIEKNRKYGDSALKPLRIFSKADTREQILVRIDDKLSRIRTTDLDDEDVVKDLLGYLILLRVSQ